MSQYLQPLHLFHDGVFGDGRQGARLRVIGVNGCYLEPVLRSSSDRDSQVVSFTGHETLRQVVERDGTDLVQRAALSKVTAGHVATGIVEDPPGKRNFPTIMKPFD